MWTENPGFPRKTQKTETCYLLFTKRTRMVTCLSVNWACRYRFSLDDRRPTGGDQMPRTEVSFWEGDSNWSPGQSQWRCLPGHWCVVAGPPEVHNYGSDEPWGILPPPFWSGRGPQGWVRVNLQGSTAQLHMPLGVPGIPSGCSLQDREWVMVKQRKPVQAALARGWGWRASKGGPGIWCGHNQTR